MLDAGARVAWAFQAHVEMIMVTPPRADFSEPGTIAACVLAHLNFRAGKDEDAGYGGIGCGGFQDVVVRAGPFVVHKGPIGAAHGN